MSNAKQKKEIVQDIVIDFLQVLELKKLQQQPLSTQEADWASNKAGLSDYVYFQTKCPVVPPEDTNSPINTGTISHGTSPNNETGSKDVHTISFSSVYKAIKALEDTGVIEHTGTYYQLKQNKATRFERFPLLKIAPTIPISHLPLNDIAVFRVPQRYADAIASFINSVFYSNDVYCIALSGLIICFDIQLPESSKYVQKKQSLVDRLQKVLRDFNLYECTDVDPSIGYTEAQIQNQARKHHEEQAALEASYGGTVSLPTPRHIGKRKQHDE